MEPVTLHDGELHLICPGEGDIERIRQICQDPDIQQWTTIPQPYGQADAEYFVREMVPAGWGKDGPTWMIHVEHAGQRHGVGMISLAPPAAGRAEIGFYLEAQARGHGYLHRALKLVLDFAFGPLGLQSVGWAAMTGNWSSWKAVWRLGFQREGTIRQYMARRATDPTAVDCWVGTLLAEDARQPACPWDGPGASPGGAPAVDPRDPDALVRQFHATYAMPAGRDVPSVDFERVHMRMGLILEETAELVGAVYGAAARTALEQALAGVVAQDDGKRDVVEAADALADLTYVVYGMAIEAGIDLPRVLAEVQASNLSKLGADGRPIYREDGKVLKGPHFFAPNVARALGLSTDLNHE